MNSTAWLIIVVAIVVLAVAGLLWWRSQQAKTTSAHLQERFGSEYDRAVAQHEDKAEAESRLASVEKRRRAMHIRPLRDESRQRFHQQWSEVQARFVDQPTEAVVQGDALVTAVMRERGYPMDDFDEQASMIALDHPDVVENYRDAHGIASRSRDASTEELRRAFVRYRALFESLVGQPPEDRRTDEARLLGSDDRVRDDRVSDDRVRDDRVRDDRVRDDRVRDDRVSDDRVSDDRVGDDRYTGDRYTGDPSGDDGSMPRQPRTPGS